MKWLHSIHCPISERDLSTKTRNTIKQWDDECSVLYFQYLDTQANIQTIKHNIQPLKPTPNIILKTIQAGRHDVLQWLLHPDRCPSIHDSSEPNKPLFTQNEIDFAKQMNRPDIVQTLNHHLALTQYCDAINLIKL